MRLRYLCPVVLLSLVAFVGCENPQIPGDEAAIRDADGVALVEASSERVRGSYVRDGVSVSFDSIKTPKLTRFTLQSASGAPLYEYVDNGVSVDVSYFNGQQRVSIAREGFELLKSNDLTDARRAGAVKRYMRMQGDPTGAYRLMETPEYRALPHISQALGARNLTGFGTPATFMLHKTGMKSAKVSGVKLPPLDVQIESSEQAPYCVDITNDPLGNGCFGLCGAGCSCWGWVCGDCCCNQGCWDHDSSCDNCSGWPWDWGNCVLCAVPIELIGGCSGGCSVYDTPPPSAGGGCGATQYYLGCNSYWMGTCDGCDHQPDGSSCGDPDCGGSTPPANPACAATQYYLGCNSYWMGTCDGCDHQPDGSSCGDPDCG